MIPIHTPWTSTREKNPGTSIVSWGGKKKKASSTLKPLFEQTISARPDPSDFHVYLGAAVWTPDQLRKELALGAWFIFPADAGTVFDSDPDSLWPQMIKKMELQSAGSGPAEAVPLVSHSFETNMMFLIFQVGSNRLSKLLMVTWANLRARMGQSLQL